MLDGSNLQLFDGGEARVLQSQRPQDCPYRPARLCPRRLAWTLSAKRIDPMNQPCVGFANGAHTLRQFLEFVSFHTPVVTGSATEKLCHHATRASESTKLSASDS